MAQGGLFDSLDRLSCDRPLGRIQAVYDRYRRPGRNDRSLWGVRDRQAVFVEGWLQRIGEADPEEERLFRNLFGTKPSGRF